MVFFFWNTNNCDVASLVGEAVREFNVDVVILAEWDVPWGVLGSQLNVGQMGTYGPVVALAERGNRLTFITRLPQGSVVPIADYHGVSFRGIATVGMDTITLGVAHLRSKMHTKEGDQVLASTAVAANVREVEENVGHSRTLLVGDLNMNPFEIGMAGAAGLHAVGVRAVSAKGRRVVEGKEYPYFYNPMWRHFGDRGGGPPGTYYYSGSQQVEFFWHMFDQVLVRPEMLDMFSDDSLQILTRIGNIDLLTESRIPDRRIGSDHLPLVFSIDAKESVK